MGPSFYNLLKPSQKMGLNRLQRVMREGSPKYHYDVLAIAAGVYAEIDIERTFPRAKKYEPLDTALVINNDVVDIQLNFNGGAGDVYIIPAGTVRRISRDEVSAIWQMRVTNLDAVNAVTVNTIDIELWRSPEDADSMARMGAI